MQTSRIVAAALAAVVSLSVVPPSTADAPAKPAAEKAEAKAGEWVDLLPGGDLSKFWQTTGNWKVEEGAVRLVPRPGEKGWSRHDAYLHLKDKQYKDFEFEFEFKTEKGGNSGFYFHVGDPKEPVKTGIEVQLYDSGSKKPDAKLTDHDAGGIIPGYPPTKNAAKPTGEWNKVHVTVKGEKLTVRINDVIVNDVDLNSDKLKRFPKTGYIAFQDHALPLWLRGMKIKEL